MAGAVGRSVLLVVVVVLVLVVRHRGGCGAHGLLLLLLLPVVRLIDLAVVRFWVLVLTTLLLLLLSCFLRPLCIQVGTVGLQRRLGSPVVVSARIRLVVMRVVVMTRHVVGALLTYVRILHATVVGASVVAAVALPPAAAAAVAPMVVIVGAGTRRWCNLLAC